MRSRSLEQKQNSTLAVHFIKYHSYLDCLTVIIICASTSHFYSDFGLLLFCYSTRYFILIIMYRIVVLIVLLVVSFYVPVPYLINHSINSLLYAMTPILQCFKL